MIILGHAGDNHTQIITNSADRRDWEVRIGAVHGAARPPEQPIVFFFFFITLKPRVGVIQKSISLEYEPASEPQIAATGKYESEQYTELQDLQNVALLTTYWSESTLSS